MPGPDPYSTGIAAGGALLNYFSGKSANNSQKEMMRAQKGILKQQAQLFKGATPTYQSLLAAGGAYAGLGQHQLAPTGGQMGSAWGNEQDQLRFAAGQDQLNHLAQSRQNQLQHQLASRGVATGSQAAALSQNQRFAQRDLAGFQRNLQIEAPHEMERRRAALANLLQPAFGQGASASAGYGQQAGMYGQQADQAFGAIGQGLQNYGYQRQLAQQGPYAGTNNFTNDENYQRWLAQQSGAWGQF